MFLSDYYNLLICSGRERKHAEVQKYYCLFVFFNGEESFTDKIVL